MLYFKNKKFVNLNIISNILFKYIGHKIIQFNYPENKEAHRLEFTETINIDGLYEYLKTFIFDQIKLTLEIYQFLNFLINIFLSKEINYFVISNNRWSNKSSKYEAEIINILNEKFHNSTFNNYFFSYVKSYVDSSTIIINYIRKEIFCRLYKNFESINDQLLKIAYDKAENEKGIELVKYNYIKNTILSSFRISLQKKIDIKYKEYLPFWFEKIVNLQISLIFLFCKLFKKILDIKKLKSYKFIVINTAVWTNDSIFLDLLYKVIDFKNIIQVGCQHGHGYYEENRSIFYQDNNFEIVNPFNKFFITFGVKKPSINPNLIIKKNKEDYKTDILFIINEASTNLEKDSYFKKFDYIKNLSNKLAKDIKIGLRFHPNTRESIIHNYKKQFPNNIRIYKNKSKNVGFNKKTKMLIFIDEDTTLYWLAKAESKFLVLLRDRTTSSVNRYKFDLILDIDSESISIDKEKLSSILNKIDN